MSEEELADQHEPRGQRRDLTDEEIGLWVVLGKAQSRPNGNGRVSYWSCRCRGCNVIYEVSGPALRKNLSGGCRNCRSGKKREDLTGNEYGRLKVRGPGKRPRMWVCDCTCGNTVEVRDSSLTAEDGTRSCKCLKAEKARERLTKHGLSHTPVWRTWWDMIARCYYPSNGNYERYGGRGIRVCQRWMGEQGFQNFHADMGDRPDGHSIERDDNNGNYTPRNCRWATRLEQMQNTRRSHPVTAQGRTLTVTGWSRETGVPSGTILYRLRAGWSADEAVSEPVREMEDRTMTHAGKTLTLQQWSEELGVPYQTLYARINRKLPVWKVLAEACITPDTVE